MKEKRWLVKVVLLCLALMLFGCGSGSDADPADGDSDTDAATGSCLPFCMRVVACAPEVGITTAKCTAACEDPEYWFSTVGGTASYCCVEKSDCDSFVACLLGTDGYLCGQTGPSGDCTNGEMSCQGDSTIECENGSWADPIPCGEGKTCKDGDCVDKTVTNDCEADVETRCKDENTLQTCNATGDGWVDSACGDDLFCSNGQCVSQLCEPETEKSCDDQGRVVTCNAAGDGWEDPTECLQGQRCFEGRCINEGEWVCEPLTETRCTDDDPPRLQTCNADGSDWSTPLNCPAGTECIVDHCAEAACEPGEDFRCAEDGRIQWCNTSGNGYLPPEDCPSGLTCVTNSEDGCGVSTSVCTPNEYYCEDLHNIKQCNATGDGYLTGLTPCDPNSVEGKECHNGECMDLCDMAEATDSYIGCEYWPIALPNSVDDDFKEGQESEFAVVVANTNEDYTATITIEKGIFNKVVTIQPGQQKTIRLPYDDRVNSYKANSAFRLSSTVPVTVYQFNPLTAVIGSTYANTNDASLLLPTHVLGEEYMVMNYRTWYRSADNITFSASNSFYTIVGTETGTTVTIKPSGETASGSGVQAMSPGQEYTYTLNRGEVLQVISSSDSSLIDQSTCVTESSPYTTIKQYCLGQELTGTEIHTSAPVAVYAGNECEFVPHYRWACDHLEQQMFPTESWTTQYIAAKMHTPLNTGSTEQPNLYKIVALQDETVITTVPEVNNQSSPFHNQACTGPLDRGESCIIETRDDFILMTNAEHPVMIGQFLVGQDFWGINLVPCYAGCGSGEICYDAGGYCVPSCQGGLQCPEGKICLNNMYCMGYGDPAFVLIPPVEQYRKEYVFLVPSTYAIDYLTLLTTNPSVEITLDGSPLQTSFTQIGSRNAYRMEMSISDGAHTLSASSKVGLMVYGYDAYVSYAYPGGLDLSLVIY